MRAMLCLCVSCAVLCGAWVVLQCSAGWLLKHRWLQQSWLQNAIPACIRIRMVAAAAAIHTLHVRYSALASLWYCYCKQAAGRVRNPYSVSSAGLLQLVRVVQ